MRSEAGSSSSDIIDSSSGTGVTVNLAIVLPGAVAVVAAGSGAVPRIVLPPLQLAAETDTVDSSPRAIAAAVYSSCSAFADSPEDGPYFAAAECAAATGEVGETGASIAVTTVVANGLARIADSIDAFPSEKKREH